MFCFRHVTASHHHHHANLLTSVELSITVFVFFAICRVESLRIYNSSHHQHHHHRIGSINFSHCCHIFSLVCAWGSYTIICCRFHIYPDFIFSLLCSLIVGTNNGIHYDPMVIFVCWHFTPHYYHHYANVPEDAEHACQVHSVERVSKINSILSIIFHAIYGAVRIQLIYLLSDGCENMCTSSNQHYHGSIPICHFRVRSWNNGLSILLCLYYWRFTIFQCMQFLTSCIICILRSILYF